MDIETLLERMEDATDCTFFACPGPDVEPEDLMTCRRCELMWDLKLEEEQTP